MNLRSLVIAAALVASNASFAAAPCTSSFSLASMGPPVTKTFGNSFDEGTLFNDCYDFSINAAANTSGTTSEIGASFRFLPTFIDVLTVSLYNSVGSMVTSPDATPNKFSFGTLAAGGYKLVVSGYTSQGHGTASYSGTLSTTAATVASPVPEAPLPAMMALAMIGAADPS
jgi:hypothetical protein